MPIQLPLDQMTLAEKLEIMESLWANLSRRHADFPSPAWHTDVLNERKRLAETGEEKFLDWDSTIAELRKELRGDSTS